MQESGSTEEGEHQEGMFGVSAARLLEGDGSEITVVDTPNQVQGCPFTGTIETSLPYILSRFDLERGRRNDGTLGLPESLWITETHLILQVRRFSVPLLMLMYFQVRTGANSEDIDFERAEFDRYCLI